MRLLLALTLCIASSTTAMPAASGADASADGDAAAAAVEQRPEHLGERLEKLNEDLEHLTAVVQEKSERLHESLKHRKEQMVAAEKAAAARAHDVHTQVEETTAHFNALAAARLTAETAADASTQELAKAIHGLHESIKKHAG